MYWILYRKNKGVLEVLTINQTWSTIEKLTGNELLRIKSWPVAKRISANVTKQSHSQPLLVKDDGSVATEDEMRLQIMADVHREKLGKNSMSEDNTDWDVYF
jgi:hypothetical protein